MIQLYFAYLYCICNRSSILLYYIFCYLVPSTKQFVDYTYQRYVLVEASLKCFFALSSQSAFQKFPSALSVRVGSFLVLSQLFGFRTVLLSEVSQVADLLGSLEVSGFSTTLGLFLKDGGALYLMPASSRLNPSVQHGQIQ